MGQFGFISRLLKRLRYPVSTPDDLFEDLDIPSSTDLTFKELMTIFLDPSFKSDCLKKYMSREDAERLFVHAVKKEKFTHDSIFSYHFNGGWLEFILHFDQNSLLRRVYIQHKDLGEKKEIRLGSS